MKSALIFSNQNSIQLDNNIIQFLSNKFNEIGENFSLISSFDVNEKYLNYIQTNNFDFVFLICDNTYNYFKTVKDILVRFWNDSLVRNDNVYLGLEEFYNSLDYKYDNLENESLLPSRSIPIVSKSLGQYGFMYKSNSTYYVVLPSSLKFLKDIYSNPILPLIYDIIGTKKEIFTFKCFGILQRDLENVLSKYQSDKINIKISMSGLDSLVQVIFDTDISRDEYQDILSNITNTLNKFIYATDNVDMYELVIELLDLRYKQLVLCETITKGNLVNKLAQINTKNISDSYVFCNYDAILRNTHINGSQIDKFDKYSVSTLYEFTSAILESSKGDICVFILGDEQESDLCYIGIGDIDGIHVYKNRLNLSSENLIEDISKTALFYLIKKLKRNDLQL